MEILTCHLNATKQIHLWYKCEESILVSQGVHVKQIFLPKEGRFEDENNSCTHKWNLLQVSFKEISIRQLKHCVTEKKHKS